MNGFYYRRIDTSIKHLECITENMILFLNKRWKNRITKEGFCIMGIG